MYFILFDTFQSHLRSFKFGFLVCSSSYLHSHGLVKCHKSRPKYCSNSKLPVVKHRSNSQRCPRFIDFTKAASGVDLGSISECSSWLPRAWRAKASRFGLILQKSSSSTNCWEKVVYYNRNASVHTVLCYLPVYQKLKSAYNEQVNVRSASWSNERRWPGQTNQVFL